MSIGANGRTAARAATLFAAVCVSLSAAALDVSDKYRSPRNPERSVRRSTELIVLHTTEAPAKSSLNKVSDRGECHYCVTEEGRVYRIVDRDKEAFHAGRSMWQGKEDVDKFSIGIECVGYHDQAMGGIQLRAIRDLVKELKRMYRLGDDKVVCHSHVAYGTPNKWHKFRQRGRKRCGMLFAMPSVRKVLELSSRPAFDADTRARRLTVGDPYLQKVLYGGVDTMKSVYGAGSQVAAAPASAGKSFLAWIGLGGDKKPAVAPKPPVPSSAPLPVAAPKPAVAPKPVPTAPKPVPTAPKPSAPPASVAELKSRGYVLAGEVKKGVTASKLAGAKWNSADTYYTIRNKVIPGTRIDPAHIEVGMGVWTKR